MGLFLYWAHVLWIYPLNVLLLNQPKTPYDRYLKEVMTVLVTDPAMAKKMMNVKNLAQEVMIQDVWNAEQNLCFESPF